MTNHVARLYTMVVGVLAFFLAWAAVVAHPWGATSSKSAPDPQVAALAARQHQLQLESLRVRRIVNARWAAYRHALAARNAAAKAQTASVSATTAATPATPSVRVVTLPPLVVTRVS